MYRVVLARSAEKEFKDIAEPYHSTIACKIDALTKMPLPAGVKRLKGDGRFYRLRIGHYRVIYEVDEATKTVDISAIGHRREIYR